MVIKGDAKSGVQDVAISGNEVAKRLSMSQFTVNPSDVKYGSNGQETANTLGPNKIQFFGQSLRNSDHDQQITTIHESFHESPRTSGWNVPNQMVHQNPFHQAADDLLNSGR